MKIRIGFVSNSSSSNFICPICDSVHCIMDSDIDLHSGMVRCERNHYFCTEHVEPQLLKQKIIDLFSESEEYKTFVSNIEKTNTWEEILLEIDEIEKILDEDLFHILCEATKEVPVEYCPICDMDVVLGCDILDFLSLYPELKEKVINEMKKQFLSYEDFYEATKSMRENREKSLGYEN